jgi:hypothetical protein
MFSKLLEPTSRLEILAQVRETEAEHAAEELSSWAWFLAMQRVPGLASVNHALGPLGGPAVALLPGTGFDPRRGWTQG